MKKALEDLNKEGGGSSTWSHDGGSDSWGQAKSQLSQIAGKLSAVTERSHQQVSGVRGGIQGGGDCLDWCVRCKVCHGCNSPWAGLATKSLLVLLLRAPGI